MTQRACRLCGRPGNVPTVAVPSDLNLLLLTVVFGVRADGGPGLVCETCKATLNVSERLVRPDRWAPAEWRLVASKRSVAAPASRGPLPKSDKPRGEVGTGPAWRAPAMNARAILSFSRDLEFATETALAKRMGCERGLWLRATLKELIDNSLDAAEEAGVATPGISVRTDGDTLTVTDNGPGMSRDLVERLCVRSERTSTREAYAAPDRGAQGNALQVMMALPFGFGRGEAGLIITSQGAEHAIRLRVNRLEQRVDLERTTSAVPPGPATITIRWPEELDLDKVEDLISEHAWLNPHVDFRLNDEPRWEATRQVRKWTPGLPIPAHWYDSSRFAHRVLLEIKRDPKITAAQFLGTFKGLTSRTKCSEVAAASGLSYKPLAALLDGPGTDLDRDRIWLLLRAMQNASRPPKPTVLGSLGKDVFESWARNLRR